jgi:hypothetical protein
MLAGIFFLPMVYVRTLMVKYGGDVSGTITMFGLAIHGEGSLALVVIAAIGLLVSSWITNAALAKTIQRILQLSTVAGSLWTWFTIVSNGSVQYELDQLAASDYNVSTSTIQSIDPSAVNFEWGFWIICLGFIIALIGTLVPEETGKSAEE